MRKFWLEMSSRWQQRSSKLLHSFGVADYFQVKAAEIIPPVVGSPDNYKQLYENAVIELNKRGTGTASRLTTLARHSSPMLLPATDEAARLRAAMRMQVQHRYPVVTHSRLHRSRARRTLQSFATCCCGSCWPNVSVCSAFWTPRCAALRMCCVLTFAFIVKKFIDLMCSIVRMLTPTRSLRL